MLYKTMFKDVANLIGGISKGAQERLRVFTSSNPGYGSSKVFRRLSASVWLTTLVCNSILCTIYLGATLASGESVANQMMAPFDLILFPLAALSLLFLIGFAGLVIRNFIKENNEKLRAYLLENEDTPVYRAVFSKKLKTTCVVIEVLFLFIVCLLLAIPLMVFAVDPVQGRAFLYTLFSMPIILVSLLSFIVMSSILTAFLLSKINGCISKLWAGRGHSIGREFNALPQPYRDAFARKAAMLGVDAQSRDMQKAAISEYEKTVLKTFEDAGRIDQNTPQVSGKTSPRRI